jgi:predicted CopG family antitoxin
VTVKRCWDYRKLSLQCYWFDEEEFSDVLLDKYEEKKKYLDFLEKEGSIMA